MSWDVTCNPNTNRTADFIGTENQPLSRNTRSTSTSWRGVIMRMSLMSSFVLVFAIAMAQAQKPYATIDYPNVNHTELTAISPSGDIVGRYVTSDAANHGFLYSKGKFTSIDYPGAVYMDGLHQSAGRCSGLLCVHLQLCPWLFVEQG